MWISRPCAQPIVDLVLRSRHASMYISDRRAVKLQRLVAARCPPVQPQRLINPISGSSAIWDTQRQQEVLAGVVQEFLSQTPETPQEHPRAARRCLARSGEPGGRPGGNGDQSRSELATMPQNSRPAPTGCG